MSENSYSNICSLRTIYIHFTSIVTLFCDFTDSSTMFLLTSDLRAKVSSCDWLVSVATSGCGPAPPWGPKLTRRHTHNPQGRRQGGLVGSVQETQKN